MRGIHYSLQQVCSVFRNYIIRFVDRKNINYTLKKILLFLVVGTPASIGEMLHYNVKEKTAACGILGGIDEIVSNLTVYNH